MATPQTSITLETALLWAKSGREWDKVYRFLFIHPDDFFSVPRGKAWSIAHQVVYHGNVALLKRILALFYDDQIDICKLSLDRKTLLDVANNRRNCNEEMYNYVQQLFHQNDLMQAAKQKNWLVFREILEKNPHLVNEKPPYSTLFPLHYVVQYGDATILEDLFRRFRFDTNVLSIDSETPLDLARRLKRNDICSILQPTANERLHSDLISFRTTRTLTNERPSSPRLPYPTIDPFPSPDFSTTLISITPAGDYQVEKNGWLPTISTEPSKTQVTDNQLLVPDSNVEPSTPVTPVSESHLLRNLKCPLTQQIFVDPVIATDGLTYERAAITEWTRLYACSPMTGEKMNANFTDNTEMKQIIQSMRR
jgi:hypothetical protein